MANLHVARDAILALARGAEGGCATCNSPLRFPPSLHVQARLVACHVLRHLGEEEGKPRSISLDQVLATHVLDGTRVVDLGPSAAAAVSAGGTLFHLERAAIGLRS